MYYVCMCDIGLNLHRRLAQLLIPTADPTIFLLQFQDFVMDTHTHT